jgi:thiamine biosynthesis lipoprotein
MASQFTFEAIGTHWQIDLAENISGDTTQTLSPEQEQSVFALITQRIRIFDAVYSRFRADSLVTAMSHAPGEYRLPEDARELLHVYKKMYDMTHGLVTPLIGQALVDAGYDATYTLKQEKNLQTPYKWDEAIAYNYPTLSVYEPVLLDFGAAGKGYLVDLVGEVLDEQGITDYVIDAGGDMMQRSSKENIGSENLRVGLEHPADTSKAIGVVTISNQSLCGSAGNRRAWSGVGEKFNHMINPETLHSPQDIIAIWVVADTTIIADGMATCLFFVAPQILQKEYTFEYVILKADYTFVKSAGFPGEIFV